MLLYVHSLSLFFWQKCVEDWKSRNRKRRGKGDEERDDGRVSRDATRERGREKLMKSSLTNSSRTCAIARGTRFLVASWQRLIHRGPEVAGNYRG